MEAAFTGLILIFVLHADTFFTFFPFSLFFQSQVRIFLKNATTEPLNHQRGSLEIATLEHFTVKSHQQFDSAQHLCYMAALLEGNDSVIWQLELPLYGPGLLLANIYLRNSMNWTQMELLIECN